MGDIASVRVDTNWEDPLKSSRHPPTPLVVALVVSVGDSGNNNASNSPAHLQRCRASAPQGQWYDLTSVSGRVRNEESPRHTLKCLSNNKDLERIGLQNVSEFLMSKCGRVDTHKEGDENRGVHHEERTECCPAIAQSVGDRTSEKDTDERTALSSLEKR